MSKNQSDSIFPAALALQALESTAYKNSAYALAEIIDNSFGAEANNIHVAIICEPGSEKPGAIAILDDGTGMDSQKLRNAIQYGNGDNVGKRGGQLKDGRRLGKFGVGLLSATFNQCRSLGIWSWQNGIGENNKARHVELDFDRIEATNQNTLPFSQEERLPEFFRKVFNEFPDINNMEQGTLVVWDKISKISWKKAETLAKNLAFECGRIYRYFLDPKMRSHRNIEIVLSIWSSDYEKIGMRKVGAVDPMFLTQWHHEDLSGFFNGPMFEAYDGGIPGDTRVNEDGIHQGRRVKVCDEEGEFLGHYYIQASHRKIPDVVKTAKKGGYSDPGNAPYGKLAGRLLGVSILREGRELILDPKWFRQDITTSRWLSVSVDFDATLDEIFGVNNSKQDAHNLSRLAGVRNEETFREAAENEHVEKVAREINFLIRKMAGRLKEERRDDRSKKNERGSRSPDELSDEQLEELREAGAKRARGGNDAPYDRQEPKDNPSEVERAYEGTKQGDAPADAARPSHVIGRSLKVDFVSEPNGGGAFFKIRQQGGVLLVVLNEDHPLHDCLKDACEKGRLKEESPDDQIDDDELSCEENLNLSQEKLSNSLWTIQRLLFCYARAEAEAMGRDSDEYESVRVEWGRIAKSLMRNE